MGLLNSHPGSWFGLPDFGVTEAVGGLFNKPTTAQGGSNLFGPTSRAQVPGATGPIGQGTPTPYQQPGQVLGTSAGGGGGGQLSAPNPNDPGDPRSPAYGQQSDPYAALRSEISGAWDSYLTGLQGTSGFIDQQRTAQEGIAGSQLKQGQEGLQGQKAKSLRDIANTTRNAFQAGNNYLGSMGAGDSSAANMYSYAINKDANKQMGDLNNFVTGEMTKLQSTYDQQIQGIAQWFAQSQQQLKQQIAEGGLKKGQDLANLSKGILDQAIAETNRIKSESSNRYNALVQWAASNSQNMGQLQQNIAQIPQAMGQMNVFGQGGSGGQPVGGGPRKTDLFGNPIV